MNNFNLKRILATVLIMGLPVLALSTTTAEANVLKTKASKTNGERVTCKVTKDVAHAPMVLSMPVVKVLGDKTVTIKTNCGNIVFTAFGYKAPTTVSVFADLAKVGYFNKTPCHRIVNNGLYVLQCGDPTGTGTGNPGFQFKDENLPLYSANDYPAGTIAMANAGPGTNGSQFFIVYADTTLPSAYTIFGKVTSGLNIVSYIASRGTTTGSNDGTPKQSIWIENVSVK